MSQNSKRRLRLFKQSSRCHWCDRETILVGRSNLPELATVDHLIDRPTAIARGMSPEERNRHVVLACYGCNQRRNKLALGEHEKLPGWGTRAWRLGRRP